MNTIFWIIIGLLFVNVGTQTSSSGPTIPLDKESNKDEIVYIKELQPDVSKYLICPTENESDIVWKKDGQVLTNTPGFEPSHISSLPKFPLICLTKEDEGNYTCHNPYNMQLTLKKITLIVVAGTTSYRCGKPAVDVIQEIPFCIKSDGYPCCRRVVSPPDNVDVSKILDESLNICSLYPEKQNPWKIKVTWSLRNNSDDSIWGWRIDTFCFNTQYTTCIQINSKDKIMNWTFSGYAFGSNCEVTVQPLPHNNDDARLKPNFVTKIFTIKSRKDMCSHKSIGRNCGWEICWPVENVTVVKHNAKDLVVSWSPSKYYKTVQFYKVDYWSEIGCEDGQKIVQNRTQVILKEIIVDKCTHYFVTVTPIFANYREEGTRSKNVSFIAKIPPVQRDRDNRIIIILCSIPSIASLCVLIFIVIRSKRKASSTDFLQEMETISEEAIEIFIVHDLHCYLCEDVAHSLVDVLNQTGRIKCILDLRCTNELTKSGMSWYEEKLQNCGKVLVICSKEGRKVLHENDDKKYYPASKVYIFILNMLLGRAIHRNNNEETFPVCFDYSSEVDIPYLFSDRPYYSLPSEIENLCLALHSGSIDNLSDWENRKTNERRNASIAKLKCAIEKVRKDHYSKVKN